MMKSFVSRFAHASLVLTIGALVAATEAHARAYIATPKAQPVPDTAVTPMIGYSGFYGFEAGAKMAWELSKPGFVPVINNTVYIEGSAFLAEKGYLFVAPLLLWEFHLHPQWSVYGEAGAELGIKVGSKGDEDVDAPFRSTGHASGLSLGAGGIYRFSPDMALRLESEFATDTLRVGLMFPI